MSASTTVQPTAASPFQLAFLGARDVNASLVAIQTADPAACVQSLVGCCLTPTGTKAPIVQWDSVRGFEPINAEGAAALKLVGLDKSPAKPPIRNPVEALTRMAGLPDHTTTFMLNLDTVWNDEPQLRQAIWNLRDPFKMNWRTVAFLNSTSGVPRQLEHDVLQLHEPLPDQARLVALARKVSTAAGSQIKQSDATHLELAASAVAGLSTYAAEQAFALSLRPEGMDLDALRERHRQMIQNTKGLSVWRGSHKLEGVGGLRAIKQFIAEFRAANMYRFGNVFWMDEMEKMLGAKGDLTGITQDYIGVILGYMQDYDVPGILLMGHPGTGKSHLAKCIAADAAVPAIRADLGAMHGSLVGDSQHAIRHAIDVQHTVSQGRPLFVATCNNVAVLPAELTNRFVWRYFVDMPDHEEKADIWTIQIARRGLNPKQPRPDDTEWNGREIDQCCRTAYQLNTTLVKASKYIVPIAQSSAEEIEIRRRAAAGRYLSASRDGAYNHEDRAQVQVGDRQVTVRSETWLDPSGAKNVN